MIETPRYTLEVPSVFGEDHTMRALPTGLFLGVYSGCYRYSCTMEELEEWLSDAEHYSDCAGQGWDFPGQLGMQSSARATAKRARAAIAKARQTED